MRPFTLARSSLTMPVAVARSTHRALPSASASAYASRNAFARDAASWADSSSDAAATCTLVMKRAISQVAGASPPSSKSLRSK